MGLSLYLGLNQSEFLSNEKIRLCVSGSFRFSLVDKLEQWTNRSLETMGWARARWGNFTFNWLTNKRNEAILFRNNGAQVEIILQFNFLKKVARVHNTALLIIRDKWQIKLKLFWKPQWPMLSYWSSPFYHERYPNDGPGSLRTSWLRMSESW